MNLNILLSGTYVNFYNEITWCGPYKVMKTFDRSVIWEEYRISDNGRVQFPTYLLTQGYIDVIPNSFDWFVPSNLE